MRLVRANRLAIAATLAALVCAGCMPADVQPSPPQLPAAFERLPANATAAWPQADFLHSFGSPGLDALASLLQANNADLAAAVARVREADARARQAGAALLPTVDARGSGTLFAGAAHGNSGSEFDWSALLSASYELDFWGRNRAVAASARALAHASLDELAIVRTTAMVGLADTFFQLQSLRERLELARLNVDTAQQLLAFIQARYDAGRASAAELASQRAALAQAQLAIPDLQQQESEARTALAVLVGQAPEGFAVPVESLDSYHEPALAPGLPSELLRRRPDLRAAEQGLIAARADLRVAHAALFPTLTLSASGGVQRPAVAAGVLTIPGTGPAVVVGADLAQTIFDHGRREAVIAETRARQQELLANYRGAILSALGDVENALNRRAQLDQQRPLELENVTQSQRAFDAAQARYREGVAEFIVVLDAQKSLYAAREQLGLYRLSRLAAALSLSKALGGGWQESAASAPEASSPASVKHVAYQRP